VVCGKKFRIENFQKFSKLKKKNEKIKFLTTQQVGLYWNFGPSAEIRTSFN